MIVSKVDDTDVVDDSCSPVSYQSGDTNNNGLLDTTETWTFTCGPTTLTQDTLNTVTAKGQPSDPTTPDTPNPIPGIGPVHDQDIEFVDVLNPAIEIVKTPSAINVPENTLVVYTFRVTNVGDTPLHNVSVVDNKCNEPTKLTSDGNGLLDPGETWVYQCTQTLTIDTTNYVQTGGLDPLNRLVTDDDTAFVNVLNPDLNIEKVASETVVHDGDTVTYTYYVTNPGTDNVYHVVVTDDKCPAATPNTPLTLVSGDDGDGILQPGEVWVYECTSGALSDDTTNVATVNGKDADTGGQDVGPEYASETVTVIHPDINVIKSVDKTVAQEGDLLTYTYHVTNPGDDPLSNVVAVDDVCSPLVFQGGDTNNDSRLDPGETWLYQCTHTVQPADPDPLVNVVDATGDDSLGSPVTDDDTKTVDIIHPDIDIAKTADKTVVTPGELVTFTYEVTNSGDVPLANVTVSDDKCSPVTYLSGDTNGDGLLDPGTPGETWIYECSRSILNDTTNVATATGQPTDPQGVPLPGIPPVTSQPVQETVTVVRPAINVVKSVNQPVIRPGDPVIYTYDVTNTGDTSLIDIDVTDDVLGFICTIPGPLAPAATAQCTKNANPAVDTLNTATAIGDPSDPGGTSLDIDPVQDTDDEFVDVINPAIEIVKSADKAVAIVGETVLYTYEVTNTGDAILDSVTVGDNVCSPVELQTNDGNGVLDPGETWVYTCSHVVLATDPDTIVNTATVDATDPLDGALQDTDTASVDVIKPDTTYELLKTLIPAGDVGEGNEVHFQITIKNTGDTWLAQLPFQDEYDVTYLSYGFGTPTKVYANPASDDTDNDGVLNWTDLAASFGGQLVPEDTWTIDVYFTGVQDTTGIVGPPEGETVNTAKILAGGLADPDGPSGSLPPVVPIDPGEASASVKILKPTGMAMASFAAEAQGAGVLVTWETLSEVEMLGFNVQRSVAVGEFVTVNTEMILAAQAGSDAGSAYDFVDADALTAAATAETMQYRLEIIKPDGSTITYGLSEVTMLYQRLYTPLVID